MGRLFFLCFMVASVMAPPSFAVEEPAGFRTEHYRAPTPQTVAGVAAISVQEAKKIHDQGDAIFVDTYETRVQWLADFKEWAIGEGHESLPGAFWLPGTGVHPLKPMMEKFLRDSLVEITQGDKNRKLVVFCRSDCWLGWNVAKKAISFGYANVLWMRDGTDGWAQAGFPMVAGAPYPLEK